MHGPKHDSASQRMELRSRPDKAAGINVKSLQPVPEPLEVNLHLLFESLARRVDVIHAIWLYVQKMLYVEKGEAKDVVWDYRQSLHG
jgi:hypothetical protein